MEVEGSSSYQLAGMAKLLDKMLELVQLMFAVCMFFIEMHQQSDTEGTLLSWGVID